MYLCMCYRACLAWLVSFLELGWKRERRRLRGSAIKDRDRGWLVMILALCAGAVVAVVFFAVSGSVNDSS